ncbi:MAG: metallophosphoesterase [Bacteroidales bacterium]|nr:metallophosphoesterase [Bacteroidales bacterium]
MKIQYCSDLHLESEPNSRFLEANPLIVAGDILILAGDVVPLLDEYLNNPFFHFISENYKQVFWIPGNHEFYHRDLSNYSTSFSIQLAGNIQIVNNIELNYEGVNFLFSTMWSKIGSDNMKTVEKNVPDFSNITLNDKPFKATDFNRLHAESIAFIVQSLNHKKGKTVVITHHLPSVLCNSELHNSSSINEAYCIDLTEYITGCDANFWIHGHSHVNHNPLYLGNTIMLTNQLGYVHSNEHAGFRHNAYISI